MSIGPSLAREAPESGGLSQGRRYAISCRTSLLLSFRVCRIAPGLTLTRRSDDAFLDHMPFRSDLVRQSFLDFVDLAPRHMPGHRREHGMDGLAYVYRTRVAQPFAHFCHELLEVPAFRRLLGRLELVIIHAAHEKRQLGAKMRR